MILLIDNFDSFTYNLEDYFYRAGISCLTLRNSIDPKTIPLDNITGLCLSAGPETPAKAGYLMDYIELFHKRFPILGVCLGHQALGTFYGAKLVKADKPMHGKISKVVCSNDPIFNGLVSHQEVVRYNSLLIKDLPKDLVSIAETSDNEIMAIRHTSLPLWGVQFHPEAALTKGGLRMIKNWVSFNKIV